jgi:hypothetical protein
MDKNNASRFCADDEWKNKKASALTEALYIFSLCVFPSLALSRSGSQVYSQITSFVVNTLY